MIETSHVEREDDSQTKLEAYDAFMAEPPSTSSSHRATHGLTPIITDGYRDTWAVPPPAAPATFPALHSNAINLFSRVFVDVWLSALQGPGINIRYPANHLVRANGPSSTVEIRGW